MTVKELKRKLDLITEDCGDFQIIIDDMHESGSLLTLEKVYVGSAWNIILSADVDAEDIEDEE